MCFHLLEIFMGGGCVGQHPLGIEMVAGLAKLGMCKLNKVVCCFHYLKFFVGGGCVGQHPLEV